MSSGENEQDSEKLVDVIFYKPEEQTSLKDSRNEWSSLEVCIQEETNIKQKPYDEGLCIPAGGDVCAVKFLSMSNSSNLQHIFCKYPSVSDPGIKESLFSSQCPVVLANDGQALYLQLCEEMNVCPVRMFHKNLLNTEINLRYYGVQQQGVQAMAKALQYNTNVSRFNLTSNFLNDDACYHLGQMLGVNSTLRELILDDCRIGASGMLRLGNELRVNHSLEYLSIGSNNLGDAGGLHFAKQLCDGAIIKRVNLRRNGLGRETALAFAEIWEWENCFTHLDLSWNNFFHVPTTLKMLNRLALSLCLQELNLSFNSLEGERVANAIKNILLMPTLTSLDLSQNKLQKEAIKIIISELPSAHKLMVFDLSSNPLTPQDAYNVLEKMLTPEIKITRLLMNCVCVQKSFVELLARLNGMKSRKDFVCEFGDVLQNWNIVGPDVRELLLRRAQFLGQDKCDMALYFMALAKKHSRPISIKYFLQLLDDNHVPLDEDIIYEICSVFAGPSTPKSQTVNLSSISEMVQRLWPDKKLQLTPASEPESESDSTHAVAPSPSVDEKSVRKKP